METSCICCNKLPAMSSAEFEVLLVEFERTIEEARNRLPENVVMALIDAHGERSQAITGLCKTCWLANCDSTNPCRIPRSFWLQLGKTSNIDNIWRLNNNSGTKLVSLDLELQQAVPASWRQVSDNQWLKEIKVPFGKLVCELLMTPDDRGYRARVILGAADPSSSDEVLESLESLPLAEAQVECDKLASLVVSNGPLTWSLSIPLTSSSEEDSG